MTLEQKIDYIAQHNARNKRDALQVADKIKQLLNVTASPSPFIVRLVESRYQRDFKRSFIESMKKAGVNYE
jgi:hypothetical protein